MKKLCLQLAATLSFLALSTESHAAIVNGTVFCDGNQNGIIDTGDVGMPGVLVIVTNENNSFSNSDVTAPDGSFSIQIPNPGASAAVRDPLSQIFIETLDPASLPPDSTIQIPLAVTNLTSTPAYFISFSGATNQTNLIFTSGTGNSSAGNWLIGNANCGSVSSLGNCKLSGNGHINGHRVVDHSFSGTVVSGNPPSGRWTDTSRSLHLQFQSTAIQSVICGTNSIEFSGTGTLRGRGFLESDGPLQFTVEVESPSEGNGRKSKSKNVQAFQAYYLRVYTSDGTTLDLVSEDTADPTDIAPEPVTTGHLRIQSE
jgi:hypothetical protein